MHTIRIQQNELGTADVLVNGFSYRIHRGLDPIQALARARQIKDEFLRLNQHARILP